jgi:hypothetical protein
MRGLFVVFLVLAVLGLGLAGAAYLVTREPDAPSNSPPVTEYRQFEKTADGKPICPKCGRSDKVLRYLYGLTREAAPEGMTSGGCVIGPDSPEHRCAHCGAKFGITSQGK